MLYIFHGPDSFTRHEAVKKLKADLDAGSSASSGLTTFDGRTVTAQELVAACNTPPFFSPRRLIIVEGLLQRLSRSAPRRRARKRKEADDEDSLGAWQALVDAVDTLPETTTLVFVEEDFAPASPLFEALSKRAQAPRGKVERFPKLFKQDVIRWAAARARSLGLKIDQRVVTQLVDIVGTGVERDRKTKGWDALWVLASEMEKLVVYANGKPVGESDVRALVAAGDVEIWPLLDALVEGRFEAALRFLQRLQQTKEAGYILQMMEREYRLVGLAREMLDQGQKSTQIASRLNIPDWKVDRLLDQAARCPPERLKRAFRAMAEADASIKRGVYDGDLAMVLLTHELAGASVSR